MAIYGYRTKSTDITTIFAKIERIQANIQQDAQRNYNNMLGKEIALWVDLHAINAISPPEGVSLFEQAVRSLAFKMLNSSKHALFSQYNISAYIHVVPYEHNVYIHVLCAQKSYLKYFEKAFTSCYVRDGLDTDKQNIENGALWRKIEKKCPRTLGMDISPNVEPDIDAVVYPTKDERCSNIARWQMLNGLMANLSDGKDIIPQLLMPITDDAYECLEIPENKIEMDLKKAQLFSILPDMQKIKEQICGKSVSSTNSDANEESTH